MGQKECLRPWGKQQRNRRKRRARRPAGRLEQAPRREHRPAPAGAPSSSWETRPTGPSRPAASPAGQAGVWACACTSLHVCTSRACEHVCARSCSPSPGRRAGSPQDPGRHGSQGGPGPHSARHGVRARPTFAGGPQPRLPTHHAPAWIRRLLGTRRIQVLLFENVWDFFFFHEYYRSAVHNAKPTDMQGRLSMRARGVHLCARTWVCVHLRACSWVCVCVKEHERMYTCKCICALSECVYGGVRTCMCVHRYERVCVYCVYGVRISMCMRACEQVRAVCAHAHAHGDL